MVADEFTWVMSEIVTRFQVLIGDQSLAAATCRKHINDYYQNQFPEDVQVDDLKSFWTQSTAVSDSGEYDLAQTDLKLLQPVTCDKAEIRLIIDHELFFRLYPDLEQYKTAPGLAIGTSDTTKVKHDDFTYEISGYSYSKSSSEVAFSGLATIPQNKYGAFSLKIDTDGTITIAEASANSTGYDTPTKALLGLAYADSSSAYMGFVTVINTSGTFVPGTTALGASGVTATYTDGRFENRQKPEAVTIFQNKVYARPKADDIYLLESPRLIRPSALDTGAPPDKKWGPAIALGAAIGYLRELTRDKERADELESRFDLRIDSIRGKSIDQLTEMEIERSFI